MSELSPLLFDLDGTLIDSRVSVDRHWTAWARRHGIDPGSVLPFVYGHRTVEIIRHFTPTVEPISEARRIDEAQAGDTEGVRAAPSAALLLGQLRPGRWAIVTSASRAIATARLRAADLPRPTVLVCAEDVAAGKPSPEGYLVAAARLGVVAASCIVVEDAATGIESAHAAGMHSIAVTTTHSESELEAADVVINDLTELPSAISRLAVC